MKTRIFASLLLVPFFICVLLGGYALKIIVVIISAIGYNEFCNAMESSGFKASRTIGYGALTVLVLIDNMFSFNPEYILYWVVFLLFASLLYGFDIENRKLEDIFGTFFGSIYVFLLFYFLILIGCSDNSIYIWTVFLTAFGTDIMAYFVGYAIGKHKLCPNLSPKKTIEGAIGGVAGSVVFNLIFSLIVLEEFPLWLILFSVIGSVVSQFGDLSASLIKRKLGIKDYGNLIPGHGGILDRFDSVLFVAPVLYIFINLFLR